jgi:hypothetical protein
MGGVIKRSFMISPDSGRIIEIKLFNTLTIVKLRDLRTIAKALAPRAVDARS